MCVCVCVCVCLLTVHASLRPAVILGLLACLRVLSCLLDTGNEAGWLIHVIGIVGFISIFV